MATDPLVDHPAARRMPRRSTGLTRRQCLQAGAMLLSLPVGARAQTVAGPWPAALAAAWDDARGRHFIGVLALQAGAPGPAGIRGSTGLLRVHHALEVPTRAHAVTPLPGGDLLAVARRPGAWMLRWRPGQPAKAARWRWSEPDRSFNGHGLPVPGPEGHAARTSLLSTETDQADGAGLLVRRDAQSLAVLDEWPTGGIDPHALLPLPDGTWLVANGGVPIRPETGRLKQAPPPQGIDSSLVRLDARGRPLGQWRLADRGLSLRHLARQADGRVGIALQAEHADPEARQNAPLLALWDGQSLRTAEAAPLAGYAGDIVASAHGGFALGATRAGQVMVFDEAGRIQARHALTEACAMAPTGDGRWLAGGQGRALQLGPEGLAGEATAPALRLDNHWRAWPA